VGYKICFAANGLQLCCVRVFNAVNFQLLTNGNFSNSGQSCSEPPH